MTIASFPCQKMRTHVKRMLVASVAIAVLNASIPEKARAAEVSDVVMSTLYGLTIGTVIGAATTLLAKVPLNHIDRFLYGATAGAIGGMVYGVIKAPKHRAMLEMNDAGELSLDIPTIDPNLKLRKGQIEVIAKVELIKIRF